MTKSKKAKAPTFTAKQRELINSAASIGAALAGGMADAANMCRALATWAIVDGERRLVATVALDEALRQYRAGYIARYLADEPAYKRRTGNMDAKAKHQDALDILAKASPDSSKADRRTQLEHKAVRAADTSVAGAKRKAGFAPTKNGNRSARQPIAKSKPATPSIGVDLVKASPKLADNVAANDYFATAAVALLATVNKNAKAVAPQISSAVSDFHAALVKAGVIVKAGK